MSQHSLLDILHPLLSTFIEDPELRDNVEETARIYFDNGSGVTVNVSSNNSATATVQGSNTTTPTLSFLPILSNGTLTLLPFISNTGFTNIGLGGLFGFGQLGGVIFGRSFSSTYFNILSNILSRFQLLIELIHDEEDNEGDFIYMEPDW